MKLINLFVAIIMVVVAVINKIYNVVEDRKVYTPAMQDKMVVMDKNYRIHVLRYSYVKESWVELSCVSGDIFTAKKIAKDMGASFSMR